LISFELFQETIPDTQNQLIKIIGKIILPENYPKYSIPRIILEFSDEKDNAHKIPTVVNRESNSFYWKETIPVSNEIISITASLSDARYSNSLYHYTQNLYPVSLVKNESLFVLKLPDSTGSDNFKNQEFDVVIYDESYQLIKKYETDQISDYPIKEIETIQLPASPFKKDIPPTQPNPTLSTNSDGDLLYIILPEDKSYNFEIYSENNLEYSALKFLENNKVSNDVIEPKNIYNVNLNQNESLLSMKLSDTTNHHTFRNSVFDIIIFQDSYDYLFKKLSTFENHDLYLTPNGELLTVLPANHKYVVEVYLNGKLINSFETFLKSKHVITKQITTESTNAKFEILNGLINYLDDVYVENMVQSLVPNKFGEGNVIPIHEET